MSPPFPIAMPSFASITQLSDRLITLVFLNRMAAGAIILKLIGAVVSFLIIFVIARLSGATITGEYSLATATATTVSLFAMMGLDQIVTRWIGGDLRQGRPDLARASLMATIRLILPVSFVLALGVAAASPYVVLIDGSPGSIVAVAPAIICSPMVRIAVVSLRSSGSIFWSQFFDSSHNFLILSGIALLFLGEASLFNATVFAGLYAGAMLLTAIWAWLVLLNRIKAWPRGAVFEGRLLRDSWPLLVGGISQAGAGWLILAIIGASLDASEVGAYRVANQVVTIIALVMTTIESLVGPDLAGDFRIGDIKGAWRRHRQASALMLLCAAAPVFLCIFFSSAVLHIFGSEFVIASGALIILAGGQLINVATGPIGAVMVMSGHQRLSLILSVMGSIGAITLSALLVEPLGLTGAALGLAGTTIFRNVGAFIIMRRKLRVAA